MKTESELRQQMKVIVCGMGETWVSNETLADELEREFRDGAEFANEMIEDFTLYNGLDYKVVSGAYFFKLDRALKIINE